MYPTLIPVALISFAFWAFAKIDEQVKPGDFGKGIGHFIGDVKKGINETN